jgi:hypothetical protein
MEWLCITLDQAKPLLLHPVNVLIEANAQGLQQPIMPGPRRLPAIG